MRRFGWESSGWLLPQGLLLTQRLQESPKPKLSNSNLVINELIRDYLAFNGYRHTLSVLLSGAWADA